MRRIALLTDFGTRDPYVAAMKGVIAARCEAAIEDLSHEIAPFGIFEAAWFLRAAAPYWPDGTIFVVVIDPGVGTSRRMLVVDDGTRFFVAPDNGVLHFIDGTVHAIENEMLFLPRSSTTFHGRDRFAPVAAALAAGLPLSEVGPRIDDRVRLAYEPPQYAQDQATGHIVAIDRFGNCITDVESARLAFAPRELRVRDHAVTRTSTNYEERGPFMIVGSTGCIELSIGGANAAEALGLSRMDLVTIH